MDGTAKFTTDKRIATFNPDSAWQTGTTYRVSFPALRDDAGIFFRQAS